jgi:NTE family protein
MSTQPVTTIEADGVFAAGGIKGLAIAAALVELAVGSGRLRVGTWRSVAGTSSGAIIAAYLAAGHTASELIEMLGRVPLPDYGPRGAVIGGALNFVRRHGLALGERFEKWFDNELDGLTFGDVRVHSSDGPPEHPYRLRMVAADITNRRILVLPDGLGRYRLRGSRQPIDPDVFKVAYAVRMSMSIPYLVNPVELVDARSGRVSTIVDGGALSGFPVWLFDTRRHAARRPTIGVRLAARPARGGRSLLRGIGWPLGMASDLIRTAGDAWDAEFVAHSWSLRTCTIPTGDIASTAFGASAEQRAELMESGRIAARAFLHDFRLNEYRNSEGRCLHAVAAN